eukprot:5236216-Amphidinium_carterae.1
MLRFPALPQGQKEKLCHAWATSLCGATVQYWLSACGQYPSWGHVGGYLGTVSHSPSPPIALLGSTGCGCPGRQGG